MSNNINPDAVYPPAIYNLKRMSHLSPTRIGAKGSYELYDPQQKALDSPEAKKMNIAGTAPGSPGSLQDYNQVVEKLRKELEDSKRKESELQLMLSDLKNPLSQNFLENPYLEGSPSNDSLEENVKDAHIKHLQRQVTVLQANLYKSEGWSNRVSAAVNERDKALDEVVRLSSVIRDVQEKNQLLLVKVESLNADLQETRKNLQLATEQLQSHNYNGQIVSRMKDEIQKQKYEIATLKESLSRLDQENKGLRINSANANSQPLGNSACSQELEHLHKVVDKLKNTVLEQRSYLLQLRTPISESSQKSFLIPTPFDFNSSLQDKDSTTGRNSSSPLRNATKRPLPLGTEAALGPVSHQAMFGHPSQGTVNSGASKENLPDIQKRQYCSGSDFVQDSLAGATKKLHSREKGDSFKMDILNTPNTLSKPGERLPVLDSGTKPQVTSRSGFTYPHTTQSPLGILGQQVFGDVTNLNVGNLSQSVNGFDALKFSQQKTQLQKPLPLEGLLSKNDIDGAGRGKSDPSVWQLRQWSLSSANNRASPVNASTNKHIDSFTEADIGLNPNQVYVNQPGRSLKQPQQESEGGLYETYIMSEESPGQFVMKEYPVQRVLDPDMVQYGNLNLSSSASPPDQIYHPPSDYQEGSVQKASYSNRGAQKVTTHAHHPASQATASGQEILYVNTSGSPGFATSTDPSAGPEHLQVRQNQDRLCPVCNTTFSHLSMEDFQTHIFECFDDGENPPETMKDHTSPDRTCFMCSAVFGPSSTQAEYENHVHSHFPEDGTGEPFEILQPLS